MGPPFSETPIFSGVEDLWAIGSVVFAGSGEGLGVRVQRLWGCFVSPVITYLLRNTSIKPCRGSRALRLSDKRAYQLQRP